MVQYVAHLSLGIPSVTFISPRPAKWKVLSVICVEGSPTDCTHTNKAHVHKNIVVLRVSGTSDSISDDNAVGWPYQGHP